MLLGNLYEASGQDVAAVQAFASIPEQSPLHWEAQRNYATMQYRMGNVEEAKRILEGMRADDPDDLTIALTLADIYRAQSEPENALKIYDFVIGGIDNLNESHWSLFYTRATAYEELEQWDEAEADFLKALDLSPDQPVVLNYLGYSWVVRGENLDRALGMIRKAVELRPNDGNIVDSLGWALYKLGRYKEAVEQLERAVLLRPEVAEINEHLGDAYWRIGRILEARFQWSHAIDLGGDGTNIDILEAKRDTLPDGDPFSHDGD
jgi:Flp pilus assembly protein TadD